MKCLSLLLALPLLCGAANLTLIPIGATWKFLDNGSNQGTAWRNIGFNDSTWLLGPAQLGYGDGDEATIVNSGPSTSRYITTYFRHSFIASGVSAITNLVLRVVRDDGAVVYLNGTEVYRNNMPSGSISYNTLASAAIGNTDESAFYQTAISSALLLEGVNLIAVEIHQVNSSSSDISFDLGLTGDRPDMTITLNGPANNAAGISLSPVLHVSVSHRVSDTPMTATFHYRALPAIGPDFTVVALPDTQFYSSSMNGGSPQTFIGQTEWIIANRVTRNIAFVTQLGDCVQNGDTYESEWWNVTNALYRLEDPSRTSLAYGIPYGVAVGNHDQSPIGSATGTSTFFNKYFGIPHFTPYAYPSGYYGGNYGANNDEHYEIFSASGMKFIIIHFEYDTAMTSNSPELDWADSLLKQYSDRQAILVAHYFMNSGEGGSFSTQGNAVYNRLKANPNLFLMLCGHVNPNGEGKRADVYDGRTVHTLLSDYQDRANGGNGWLRLLEFSPANSLIRVKTYSPLLNQYEIDSDSQFELPYDMLGIMGSPFAIAAVNSGVTGGSTAAQIQNLTISTDYEWYVTLTDGATTITSPKWRFRTADVIAPAAPSDLAGTAQSSSSIQLNWTDNSTNETGFEIYASTDGNFSPIATVAAPPLTVIGLASQTAYSFYARAFNEAGYSEPSNTETVTTLAPPPPPAEPSSLQVASSGVSETSIALEWTDNATDESGFVLERGTNGLDFGLVAALSPNSQNFIDSGLQAATWYYYRIAATNSGGSSPFATCVPIQTMVPPAPQAPEGVTATGGERQISLSWLPSPGALYYQISRTYAPNSGEALLGGYERIYETSFVDTSAEPFLPAYYRVRAVNAGGPGAYSIEVTATAYRFPQMPFGFTNDQPDVHTLPLQWSTSADADAYRLERSTDQQMWFVVAELVRDQSEIQFHVDQGLQAGTTFFYRLYAMNQYGSSLPAELSAATLIDVPTVPTGLSASAGDGQIALSWNPSERATSYEVLRLDGVSAPVTLATTATALTDNALANGTPYTYRVRALNSSGASAYSPDVIATPTARPSAPSGLAAVAGDRRVALSWNAVAGATSYKVKRATSAAGPFFTLATVTGTTHIDTTVANGTEYFYTVSAVNGGGESADSAPVSATPQVPPAAPTNLQFSSVTSSSMTLTWRDNSNNEDGFAIERALSSAGPYTQIGTVSTGVRTFVATGLARNTTYYFRVRAYNDAGYSTYVTSSKKTAR